MFKIKHLKWVSMLSLNIMTVAKYPISWLIRGLFKIVGISKTNIQKSISKTYFDLIRIHRNSEVF